LWELKGNTDFPRLLRALIDFVPNSSILYFEGGTPNERLLEFFAIRAVPECMHISMASLWPRPLVYHVPATAKNLTDLAHIAETCAGPELAIHFHVYENGRVLLEWHDVFHQPMFVSGVMNETLVKTLAKTLGMSACYREVEPR